MGAYIWLWGAQLELDQRDFSLLHARRASRGHNHILVQRYTLDKLRVFDRPTDLLHYPDITKVDVRGRGGDQPGDRRYCDWSKEGRVLGYDLCGISAVVRFGLA